MPITKLVFKEGGARDVTSWDVHVARAYRPVWSRTLGDPRGRIVAYDPDDTVTVQIVVEFHSDEAAREFEAKVRAMMPEVAQ